MPAWIFVYHLAKGEAALAVYLASLVMAIFGCVLLHELGHALMARFFGISTQDITLYPIGGVARLSRLSDRPWEEFWIALAGPAVNGAIAGLLLCVVLLGQLAVPMEDLAKFTAGTFLFHLLFANVFLILFNLLPVFPMDGGRVLRALLATRLGILRATELAAGLGAALSGVFTILGLLALVLTLRRVETFLPPMLVLVGPFLLWAGQQELAGVRYREVQRRSEPLDVLPVDEETAQGMALPSGTDFSGFTWDSKAGHWIKWRNGRPIQIIAVESE